MPERWQHELRKLKRLEPPASLWDQVMRGPGREPPRSHNPWRVIAPIAAALAVAVVVGTLGLVRAFAPAPDRPVAYAMRFADPQFGWTIRVPNGMWVRHFHSTGMTGNDGVRVTSFPPNLRPPSTGSPPMAGCPASRRRGGPSRSWPATDSRPRS